MLLTDEELIKIAMQHILYQVITGSTSYGLNNENSDVDEKAVASLPKELLFALAKKEYMNESISVHEPKDFEVHFLKKFFTLLCNQNPTIKEMVWTQERFIIKNSKYGQMFRDNRQIFLTSGVYKSFGGYAQQQLIRIKGGLEKLTEQDKLDHLEFTLSNLIDGFGFKYTEAESGILLVNSVTTDDEGKQNVNLKINYDNIPLTQMNGMLSEMNQTLKTYNKPGNRNSRKTTEKLFKHAMHLLRLLYRGIEALETGIVSVYCDKERELLLGVRNEEYTWDEIFEMVAELQVKLKKAYQKTDLPPEINHKKVQELYTDIMLDLYAA